MPFVSSETTIAGELALADTTLPTRIQAALEQVWLKAAPYDQHGVSYSVIVNGLPQFSGVVGYDHGKIGVDTNKLCEIGSITKTFVTALIMRLQEQGKLSIKDSIHKWLPSYKNIDSNITITQLLNHSSGVFDIDNDDTSAAIIRLEYETDPSHRWTPEELLTYVGKPNFAKGAGYRYCNTGFVLLAMIAERAGGKSLRDQLHENFIDPLHLASTYVGGSDSVAADRYQSNWILEDSATYGNYYSLDKTAQLTGSFGDGNVISRASDVAQWCRALYLGQVISPASVKSMISPLHQLAGGGGSYGMGTQAMPFYTRTFYGHSGHVLGFVSIVGTNLKDSVTYCIIGNSDSDPYPKQITLNDFAIALLTEVYRAPSGVAHSSSGSTPTSLYPNPAHQHGTIEFMGSHEGSGVIRVYDELGREVLFTSIMIHSGSNVASLDLSNLNAGNYQYTIMSGSGITHGKFVIAR